MALNIGTNISYRGKHFLDQRQGHALLKSELLSWSEPVPDGFEVYCEGKWYVYKENYYSQYTGHFKLRIDNEVEDSRIQNEVDINTDDIQHIKDTVYPLEFHNVTGGGPYLVGTQMVPEISWELWKDGVKITAESIEIIFNGIDDSRGVVASKERYVGSRLLPNEESLIYITATYRGQSKRMELPILYNLIPKKYLILSNSKEPFTSLPEEDDNTTIITEWAGATTASELGKSVFESKYVLDCSGHELNGGVYIHYLIPKRYYPGEEKHLVLVGGIEMSDTTITEVANFFPELPEDFRNYVDICFNRKQNGLLNIEFKEVVFYNR